MILPFFMFGAFAGVGDTAASLGLPERTGAVFVFYPADALGQKSYPLGDQFIVNFSASVDVDQSSVLDVRLPIWGRVTLFYRVEIVKSVTCGEVGELVAANAAQLQAYVSTMMRNEWKLPMSVSECALRSEALQSDRIVWGGVALAYLWCVYIPLEVVLGLGSAWMMLRRVVRARRGRCEECGYQLGAGDRRCSECGCDRIARE